MLNVDTQNASYATLRTEIYKNAGFEVSTLLDEYNKEHVLALMNIVECLDHAVQEVDGNGVIVLDRIHSALLQDTIDRLDTLRSDYFHERLT